MADDIRTETGVHFSMKRTTLVFILGILGTVVAAVAGLAEQVPWLAALCGGLSSSCKETARFALLGLPLWAWGTGYYVILVGLTVLRKELVPAWVAVGFGFELTLLWIMVTLKLNCVFCLVNAVVLLLTLLCTLEKSRLWQTVAVSSVICILSALAIPLENAVSASAPPHESWEQSVVARVKGREITAGELILPIAKEIHELELQVYRKKKEHLDWLIADMLLRDEAQRRGINVQALANELVPPREVEPSDEEIDRYYLENQAKWKNWSGPPEELRRRVASALMGEKGIRKVVERSRTLPGGDDVAILLKEPEPPTLQVNVDNDPIWGTADAQVTVIEFSDYECPVCRKTHDTIKAVRAAYQGKIRWVFKDFPLRMHQHAQKAAEAAQCAGEQGKFWEYQDLLYKTERGLQVEQLKNYARELGLNAEQFDSCLDGGKFQAQIESSMADARKRGINATPTFLINGKYHSGAPSLEQFKALIDAELKER